MKDATRIYAKVFIDKVGWRGYESNKDISLCQWYNCSRVLV